MSRCPCSLDSRDVFIVESLATTIVNCPLLNSPSYALERAQRPNRPNLLIPIVRTGMRLELNGSVDRPLAADVVSCARRRRVLQVALPLLVVALLLAWLPGWLRPSIPSARLRTAVVTMGPIEAAIMATSTVVPEARFVLC